MSVARPRGLRAFFAPRGVAVIGASHNPHKVGNAVLRNLRFGCGEFAPDLGRGFPGPIVPVNPKGGQLYGLEVVSRVSKISGPIDLCVICVPAPKVPQALDAAARRGVLAAIVLAGGTADMGQAGRRLEVQLRGVARNTGVRVMGPNCTGLFTRLDPPGLLSASFFSAVPPAGSIALIAQSGAIAQAIVNSAEDHGLGLRHVISLGDKVDVQDDELLRHVVRDPEVRVIGLHIESLEDPRGFHAAAREVSAVKPIVVLHGGHTSAGMRATQGHEGLFGHRDASLDGALRQPGLHVVKTLSEFNAALLALSTQPPARGRRVAIVTNGGGTAVLAADAVSRAGLDVVPFRQATVERLREFLGHSGGSRNPVDLRGDADAARIEEALEIASAADEVDALLLVLTAQATTEPRALAERLGPWRQRADKPLLVSSVGFARERLLARDGIPEFAYPETAAAGLAALVARGAFERRTVQVRVAEEEAPQW